MTLQPSSCAEPLGPASTHGPAAHAVTPQPVSAHAAPTALTPAAPAHTASVHGASVHAAPVPTPTPTPTHAAPAHAAPTHVAPIHAAPAHAVPTHAVPVRVASGHAVPAPVVPAPAVSAGTAFARTVERLLPATPASVRDARSLVRDELTLSGAGDLVDDCVLVVSELVTNAVRHGGAACALRLRCGAGHVYGELFDPGAGAPRVCEADDEATGGRGLQIVGVLTDGWGVTWPAAGGKVVWFVLGAPVPHPRTPGAPAAGSGPNHTA
ncbi:ATP-binding protein [Streptosporangium sandarakinum]|uniref:ATP-binding protein n=1 Tax=Streptosporangium sandarakinum TaxID=1260955 RepID=UPI0033B17CA2